MESKCAVYAWAARRKTRNSSQNGELSEVVNMPQKPWRQLAFVLGEAALSLVSSGVVFIVISRVAGPELLGTYALAFGWLMLFQGISSFGIPELLMREVGAYGRDVVGQVFHAMLLGLGSGFVGLCLMVTTVRFLGYSTHLVQVITIASLALIPAFLNLACRSVFLALRQMHLTFLAALVEATIVASVSLVLLISGYREIALIATLVIAKVASASVSVALLRNRVFPGDRRSMSAC
jgi:O-antigen/teichoic acid export membrane protein